VHEFGLMQTALEAALEHTRSQGAARIHRITLQVGDLSGAVPEALHFAYEALRTGTPAEQAELEVQTVPVLCSCSECGQDFRPDNLIFACPKCGMLSSIVQQGRELLLTSIEVS
jgi:hydrogenase nickel incorporation protein HypA/HybF